MTPPVPPKSHNQLVGLQAKTRLWAELQRVHGRSRAPTTAMLAEVAGCLASSARDWLHAWAEAGAVERIREGRAAKVTYRWRPLTRAKAPPGEATAETARERMWRTAKMLKTFSAEDLAIHASIPGGPVPVGSARIYIQFLAAARYLVPAAAARRAKETHAPALWRFVRSTGPLAPQVIRPVEVWDPNLKQTVWRRDPPTGGPQTGGKAQGQEGAADA